MTLPETIVILLAGYYAAFALSWMKGPRRGARVGSETLVILLGGVVTAMIFATGKSVAGLAGAGAMAFILVLVALPLAFIVLGACAGAAIGRLKRQVVWWKPAAAMAILAPVLAMMWLTAMVQDQAVAETASTAERAGGSQLGQPVALQATW
ncbi:hypothetical protein [Tropicimonas sp. S265A]|uniref:hypothetical protein n=1 Tax=Tropicimonas sp. S265A TaxID=3415134 RepID=UPI003C7B14CC